MFSFKKNEDLRGELVAIDSAFDLPFDIKRIFYISQMDKFERGFHAHRKCQQILVPISGSFTLKLDNGNEITEYNLENSNQGVLIPLYHWLVMSNFSENCIILVLCSYKYDETEYIRDYDVFLKEIHEKKSSKIQNFSLKEQTTHIKRQVMQKIENIIDDNHFVMGNDVIEFENKFKNYNNSKHCIAVSNGCSALKIAINALQLKNPKILVQSNTYVAVPLVCEELKIPYEVIDIDDNLLLDLNKLDKYLDKNRQPAELWFENNVDYIIIVVHLYGNSIDMNKLQNLKEKHNFKVIEDSAQAHGSSFNDQKLGTFGDLGCFSFYPSKNLGAFGEGGAILTNDDTYAKFCKYYRNYGSVERYKWEIVGANERIHNIQGGILSIKLDYLDEWNGKRNKLASLYYNNIKNHNKLRMVSPIENCISNIHLFVVIVDDRDELKEYLENNNIGCAIHYPKPFYESEAYKHITANDCEKMNFYKDKLLSLPMYPELSENDVVFICDKINTFYI